MAKDGRARVPQSSAKTLFIALLAAAVALSLFILIRPDKRTAAPAASSSDTPFIITEIMSDNMSTLKDDSGNYSDWIEIYNASGKEMSLSGYYLSDNKTQPLKWEFPAMTVGARQYIVIFCSGEDRYDSVTGACHTNFKLSSKGETVVLSQPSSFLSVSVSFGETLPDVSYGLILPDESDSLEYKWLDSPTPGRENDGKYADSAFRLPSDTAKGVVINEYQTHNTCTLYDSDSDYSDWVELYNSGDEDADLSGCVLTDDETDTRRWYFPEGVIIKKHEYLTVFLSGKNRYADGELHASFSVGEFDTEIVLYDRTSRMIDRAAVVPLPDDVSYGRTEGNDWAFFTFPTPGSENPKKGFDSLASSLSVEGKVYISEVCAASARIKSVNQPDWIEICNGTGETVDLTGYGLGRSPLELREFVLDGPVLAPGEYAAITAAGSKAASGQAGFKVSSSGSTLYLTDPKGRVVDVFDSGKLTLGITSGRAAEYGGERRYFAEPTPGQPNSSETYAGYAPKPEILSEGGYVKAGTKVQISVPDGTVARYTTDGSVPDAGSPEYSDKLTVDKSMTLTAAAFADGKLRSDCDYVTFLTGEKSTLPVVCVSGNAAGLFSDRAVALTGEPFTDMLYSGGATDSERPMNIEYFEDGRRLLKFSAGIRGHGDGTRVYDKHSIAVMVRDMYGRSTVTYPFFKESGRPTAKALVLRAGGQDSMYAFLRDSFCARVVLRYSENLVASDTQPVALYINGRYWGLYEIREKINENFLELNYGIPEQDLDIIRGNYILDAGSFASYRDTMSYMSENNMNDSEVYNTVCEMIDIDSAIDYLIFEHFFMNNDAGNIRIYNDRANGKWRWIFYDLDMSMREGFGMINMNAMNKRYEADMLIKYLLRSDAFRERLLERYSELLDTAFRPDELISILEELEDEIKPEVERNYQRWHIMSMRNWTEQIETIKKNLRKRPDNIKAEIKSYFNLSREEYEYYFE